MPDHLGAPSKPPGMVESTVPNYLKFPVQQPPDWNDVRRLNEIVVNAGWQRAIEEVYRTNPAERRYVTDPAHHKFLDLLPLTRESVVLEMGPGHGQNTIALAERAKFVHAVEIDPDRAKFAAERCRQEHLSNVAIVCGGDDCRFPYYDDGMFDGVVVNLVLEWCGQRDPAASSLEMQQRFLKECWRVLKPGGWFYVTTKNRYGLRYLLGRRDEHTFLWPFGQALPRWLLEILLRIRGKSGPGGRGLIRAHIGALRRLLIEAGFRNPATFPGRSPNSAFPGSLSRSTRRPDSGGGRRPGFFSAGGSADHTTSDASHTGRLWSNMSCSRSYFSPRSPRERGSAAAVSGRSCSAVSRKRGQFSMTTISKPSASPKISRNARKAKGSAASSTVAGWQLNENRRFHDRAARLVEHIQQLRTPVTPTRQKNATARVALPFRRAFGPGGPGAAAPTRTLRTLNELAGLRVFEERRMCVVVVPGEKGGQPPIR